VRGFNNHKHWLFSKSFQAKDPLAFCFLIEHYQLESVFRLLSGNTFYLFCCTGELAGDAQSVGFKIGIASLADWIISWGRFGSSFCFEELLLFLSLFAGGFFPYLTVIHFSDGQVDLTPGITFGGSFLLIDLWLLNLFSAKMILLFVIKLFVNGRIEICAGIFSNGSLLKVLLVACSDLKNSVWEKEEF
jgi:hypothetical protein